MKKEIRTTIVDHNCSVCGRTVLRGEKLESYLTTANEKRAVCDLCSRRVESEGWVREAVAGDLKMKRGEHRQRRSSLIGWLKREGEPGSEVSVDSGRSDSGADERDGRRRQARTTRADRRPRIPKVSVGKKGSGSAKKVHAVPTGIAGKMDRAIELFNSCSEIRTVTGLAKTLGVPKVSVAATNSSTRVSLVVAWELSWYQYSVGLGESDPLVQLLKKGNEIDEIDDRYKDWNAVLNEQGKIALENSDRSWS